MDTLDFLRRVLPSEGIYCAGISFQDEGGFRQSFVSSVDELAELLSAASEKDNDTYYAVSSFNTARRKQDNVLATKVIAIDVDVGKEHNSYALRAEALVAIGQFVDSVGLPRPVIVSSGMGFHVYWVLTRELPPEEWQPIADAMKACWQSRGLVADPAVTADSARILRPVGTNHLSSGRQVNLIMDAPDVSPEEVMAAIQSYAQPKRPQRTTLINNLANIPQAPPAVPSAILAKCKQVAKAVAEQGSVDEPLWYSVIGVAAYTVDPEETAKAWSSKHPGYNEAETISKVNQWKNNATGPATCTRFEQLNPSGCKGCNFKGKISTPTQLGRAYQEAPIDVSAPDPVAHQIPLPRPFKRTDGGIKITIEDTDIDICPFDLYPVGYGRDEVLGYETVRFHWKRPHVGWTLLSFRQALLTDGHRDFAVVMADNGIVLQNAKQTEFFRVMLRTYMDELKKARALSNLYSSMGWKEASTQFVLGDTVIKRDLTGNIVEEKTTLSAHASKTSSDLYAEAGTLSEWAAGTKVLEVADMPWHMFALNMGFAAPLFAFTGLKGLTISLYGNTGGGKTLIQYWIQSIYGDPDKLHFAAKFTQNTLFSRLALYANLPMTIDEATMFNDKDVGDFLYWVSQGRDKARLNRAAEEREAKTWATPVIVSTNVSMQSKLVSSGLDTDAQMARLLEVNIPPHKLFKKDSSAGQKIYSHLMSNYGTAGREYIKELVNIGEDGLRKLIEEARATFSERYDAKFTGEERYWEMAVVLQDLGASIAKRLGLIEYDYTKGTRWVLGQLGALRSAASENKADAFDMLSEYLNEYADCAVTVMYTGTSRPLVDMSRAPRGEIRARFDVYRPKADKPFERGILYVDKTHFRRWLSTKGADFKSFIREIDIAGINATPRSGRAMLGKDTSTKTGTLYVIGIDLNHPRLSGMINDADEALDRILQSRLQVVASNPEL